MPVLAVAHSKGGAGKTTSTFNIICELKPDITIDIDVGHGLTIINGLRPEDKRLNIIVCAERDELLSIVREYDEAGKLVVIDCGGFDGNLTRAAIAVADLILTPANDSLTERIGLSQFDQTLAAISADIGFHIQAHLLICKVHPSRKHFPALDTLLAQAKHISRMQSVISYRPGKGGHIDGLEEGRGVTELVATRHSAAGKEILALVEEIKNLLEI